MSSSEHIMSSHKINPIFLKILNSDMKIELVQSELNARISKWMMTRVSFTNEGTTELTAEDF